MDDKTQEIHVLNEDGKELFNAIQDSIVEHDLNAQQTLCAVAEILVWVILAGHDGDTRKSVQQFELLAPALRKGIVENAPAYKDIATMLDRVP